MKASGANIVPGFTLTELMVALSIAGMLLTIGIPSFSSAIVSNRLSSNTNELVAALNLARSEAVRRGDHVVVRKNGENWENGWRVFVDIDRATTASKNIFNSSTDIELRVFSALPATYTLRGNNNVENFIRYQPDGTSNTIGSFALCDAGNINGARLLVVNSVGRVRIAPDVDHDGVPEKENGAEILSCTSGF